MINALSIKPGSRHKNNRTKIALNFLFVHLFTQLTKHHCVEESVLLAVKDTEVNNRWHLPLGSLSSSREYKTISEFIE